MNPMLSARAGLDGLSPTAQTRIDHLFRHSLRAGRIHPLYPQMLKYRQARAHTPPQPR
ncbi:hypothetical protein [Rhizobacter sp. Root1221]|uniref:hypothetical protein n=1 Tax=Rhizobacter sp. Root1221 TaxID=1736433 RepID=UPI000A3F371F|nr:hypothetical protein [Rhizobacter sp. Root1221]